MRISTLELSMGEERSRAMKRRSDAASPAERSRFDTAEPATPQATVAGIVGDSILGSADVARVRERRRIARLRRLVGISALALGWVVIRKATGRGVVPALHLPHWLGGSLPVIVIVLMLGVVMLAPFLGAGRSPHTLIRPGETAVGLEDLVGIDGIKAEVVRSINLFLAHQTFRDTMGGSARRGVLFEGPPGTGKTFVAKAMAKEANVPFLFVSASAFQSMYYGQTNRKIRSYFKQLRKYARKEGGAIGFIEEIDAIGATRRGMGGGGANEGVTGVVNELLVQLQSFDSPTRSQRFASAWIDLLNRYLPDGSKLRKPAIVSANVLVVGATNRKDDLDPALIRPGRFDRSIYFGLPGRRARADIVAYYLGKKAHEAELDEHGAVDIVAGMTFGYSPAALERLMDEALVIALTHGRSAMTMTDVAEAKMLVELGVTDETIYTPDERERVATHEAGHAAVAYFVGLKRQLDVLSIVKRRDSLGLLQHSDTEERFTKSSEEMHALLQIAMGGMVAEEHWFDEVSTGPASDLAAATTIGAQMIGACGMGNSLISVAAAGNGYLEGSLVDKVLGDKDARGELDTLLMQSCDVAKSIVQEHPGVVEALRDALLERDELVGSEITEVIEESLRHASWPGVIAPLRPSPSPRSATIVGGRA
jgi:cell division protease FtsH